MQQRVGYQIVRQHADHPHAQQAREEVVVVRYNFKNCLLLCTGISAAHSHGQQCLSVSSYLCSLPHDECMPNSLLLYPNHLSYIVLETRIEGWGRGNSRPYGFDWLAPMQISQFHPRFVRRQDVPRRQDKQEQGLGMYRLLVITS